MYSEVIYNKTHCKLSKAWFTYSCNLPATAASTATVVCRRQFIPYVNTLPRAAGGCLRYREESWVITVPPARQKSNVNIVPAASIV